MTEVGEAFCDSKSHTLTIVKYNKSETNNYVNLSWEIRDQPFKGDVINSYNDGPPSLGAKPMGPICEILKQHFTLRADEKSIDRLYKKILGVSVNQINDAFRGENK